MNKGHQNYERAIFPSTHDRPTGNQAGFVVANAPTTVVELASEANGRLVQPDPTGEDRP
jgi:hypothetical protein